VAAIWELPRVKARPVGASGTVAGVADTGVHLSPMFIAFTAATDILYGVPLVRPVTV